jgi:hypothetical protein
MVMKSVALAVSESFSTRKRFGSGVIAKHAPEMSLNNARG